MFRKDHALSEKAIKKLGLENAHEDYELADQTPVKEWDSSEAYWNEWMVLELKAGGIKDKRSNKNAFFQRKSEKSLHI